jgi:hypothetical protein
VIGISRPRTGPIRCAAPRSARLDSAAGQTGCRSEPFRAGSGPTVCPRHLLHRRKRSRMRAFPCPHSRNSFRAAVRGDGVGVSAPAHPGSDLWCRSLAAVGWRQRSPGEAGERAACRVLGRLRRQAWRPYAITAGIHGGGEREVWERLIAHIDRAVEANSRLRAGARSTPATFAGNACRAAARDCHTIGEHIDAGGKLGFLQLATRPEWRLFIKTARVTAGQPSHREHFAALARLAELEVSR